MLSFYVNHRILNICPMPIADKQQWKQITYKYSFYEITYKYS